MACYSRHIGIAGIVIATVAIFATMLAVELDAEPVVGSRPSSCLEIVRTWDMTLPPEAERELRSWCEYARGLHAGLSQGKLDLYKSGIERALLADPSNNVLRVKWFELNTGKGSDLKAALQRYKPIYEALPKNVDNVLGYVSLMTQNKQHRQAIVVLRRALIDTGQCEGRLLRELVLQAEYGRILKSALKLDGIIETMSSKVELRDPATGLAAIGVYWHSLALETSRRLVLSGGKPLPEAERERLLKECAERQRRALSAVRRINVVEADTFSSMLVCDIYRRLGCWRELAIVLDRLERTEAGRMRWWLENSFELAKHLRNYGRLIAYLDRQKITKAWNTRDMKYAVDAYLHSNKHLGRAIEIQQLIVAKHPEKFDERGVLGSLLLYAGRHKEGLAVVSSVPLQELNEFGRMTRNRLMRGCGDKAGAYNDFWDIASRTFLANLGDVKPRELGYRFYYEYSSLCWDMGKREQGLALAKMAYDRAPERADMCNFYGYLLAEMNRELPLAERLIEKALKSEPKNAAYLDSLAWVYYRQGRCREALRQMAGILEHLVPERDSSGELRQHMRDILKALGMPTASSLFEVKK